MIEEQAPPPGYQPPKSAEELLERYKNGERNLRGALLAGADLQGAELPNITLRRADLRGTAV